MTKPQPEPQSRQTRSRIRDPTRPARPPLGREAHGSQSTCRSRRFVPRVDAPLTQEAACATMRLQHTVRLPREASEVRSRTPREHAAILRYHLATSDARADVRPASGVLDPLSAVGTLRQAGATTGLNRIAARGEARPGPAPRG